MGGRNRAATPPAEVAVDERLSRQEFGKRLHRALLTKGWTQSELARHAGIGRDSVSNYIRGKTMPTPLLLHRMANALRMDPNDLLPNHLERALDDEQPAFEVKEAHGYPGQVWLRINRMVTMEQALKIMQTVNE